MALCAAILAAGLASAAAAADGWEFTLGAGVFGENVYPGSSDHYAVPMPTFKASYARGEVSGFISLQEGVGVTYMNRKSGLLCSASLNAGSRRNREDYSLAGFSVKHSDRTRQLLSGSPNLTTTVSTSAMLGYMTPLGIVGASIGYHPTTVKPYQTVVEEKVEHGFLYSALYIVERPVANRLSLSGLLSIELMNSQYADTWYSTGGGTPALAAFSADAGLRDAQIALQLNYDLSQRVRLSFLGVNTILLGDAKESPYTVEKHQRAMSIETSYRF